MRLIDADKLKSKIQNPKIKLQYRTSLEKGCIGCN